MPFNRIHEFITYYFGFGMLSSDHQITSYRTPLYISYRAVALVGIQYVMDFIVKHMYNQNHNRNLPSAALDQHLVELEWSRLRWPYHQGFVGVELEKKSK